MGGRQNLQAGVFLGCSSVLLPFTAAFNRRPIFRGPVFAIDAATRSGGSRENPRMHARPRADIRMAVVAVYLIIKADRSVIYIGGMVAAGT